MKECKGCSALSKLTGDKPCEFNNNYAEGSSISGFYVQDIIAVVEDPSQSHVEGVRATFGCITEETNQFLTQAADGILGLSPNRESNLLEKIYEEHAHITAEQLEFGICLALDGGEFSIGNINERLHRPSEPPTIVKFRHSTNPLSNLRSQTTLQRFYSLDIQQIFVGSRSLELKSNSFDGDGIFVDSGATYSYLNSYQYNIVLDELDKVCQGFDCVIVKGDANRCYHFRDQSKTLMQWAELFPNITIRLPNSADTVNWTASSYLMVRNDTAREVCVGLQPLNRMILGGNWMTDKDLYFDLSESRMLVYNSPGCKPYTEASTYQPTIRLMYETMMPALLESSGGDYELNWTWIIILVSILAMVFIIALLLVCLMNALDTREKQTRQTSFSTEHQTESQQTEYVHTLAEMHEGTSPDSPPSATAVP